MSWANSLEQLPGTNNGKFIVGDRVSWLDYYYTQNEDTGTVTLDTPSGPVKVDPMLVTAPTVTLTVRATSGSMNAGGSDLTLTPTKVNGDEAVQNGLEIVLTPAQTTTLGAGRFHWFVVFDWGGGSVRTMRSGWLTLEVR